MPIRIFLRYRNIRDHIRWVSVVRLRFHQSLADSPKVTYRYYIGMIDFLNENLAKVWMNNYSREVFVTCIRQEGGAGADFCVLQLSFANEA